MPTYIFACPKCQKTFEKVESMAHTKSKTKCTTCGTTSEKVLQPSPFTVKGASYANGYSGDSNVSGHGSEIDPNKK